MRSVQRGISATFLVIAILVISIASAAGYFVFSQDLKEKVGAINSFEECAKHYPVMESYPEQCKTPDGKHFTRELSEEEKQRLVSPLEPSTSVSNETAADSINCIRSKHPKFDAWIIEFVNSTDRQKFAELHNIKYANNQIRVDVSTFEEHDWTGSGLIEVETTFGRMTQGLVKIDDLCKISGMPEVRFIETPAGPTAL